MLYCFILFAEGYCLCWLSIVLLNCFLHTRCNMSNLGQFNSYRDEMSLIRKNPIAVQRSLLKGLWHYNALGKLCSVLLYYLSLCYQVRYRNKCSESRMFECIHYDMFSYVISLGCLMSVQFLEMIGRPNWHSSLSMWTKTWPHT